MGSESESKISSRIIIDSSWKNVVKVEYKKPTEQAAKEYTLEIYDIRGDMFFGWDLTDGKTKSFKFASVVKAEILSYDFIPRFKRKQ